MIPQTAQDEYEEQAEAAAVTSGYESTRDADVEDQREYRSVPRGTLTTLVVSRFELNAGRGKPYIFAKVAVDAPEEFADGSSNFSVRLSLNPVVAEGKKGSGWTMTRDILTWMYAAAHQVTSAEAKKALLDPVYAQFPTIGPDDVEAFHEALVAQCNDVLADNPFVVKIGMEDATFEKTADGATVLDEAGEPKVKYAAKQSFGKFQYPKATTK